MREDSDPLLLSSRERGEGEAEPDAVTPILRRPSPGFLGMGEVEAGCCRDPALSSESLGGTPPPLGRVKGEKDKLGNRRDCDALLAVEKVEVSINANGVAVDQCLKVEVVEEGQKLCSSLQENNRGSLEMVLSVEVPELLPLTTSAGDVTSEVGAKEQKPCPSESSPSDDTNASADVANGTGELIVSCLEPEEECQGVLEGEEVSDVQVLNAVAGEDCDEFPGLLPLTTVGGRCSPRIDIGAEVGLIAGEFDADNGCDDASFLVLSEFEADCVSMKLNGDAGAQDGHCSPALADPENSEATCLEGRCETLPFLKPEEMNCGQCCTDEPCSMDYRRGLSLETEKGPFVENVEVWEDGSEVNVDPPSEETNTCLQVVVEGDRCESLLVEKEACNLENGSANEVGSCSTTEELTSQQQSHFFTSVENCSSKCPSALNSQGVEADAGGGIATCTGDINGGLEMKSSSMVVFRRTNPKRAASSRSSLTDGKTGPLSRTRNSGRKCRKAVSSSKSFSLSTIAILNESTRKRRCSCRRARLSVWGNFENLIKIVDQLGELAGCASDAVGSQNKRSKEGRPDLGRKKRSGRKDGSLQVSSVNCAALSDQRMLHAKVDSQTSMQTGADDCIQTSDIKTDLGISNKVGEVEQKLAENKCAFGVRLPQRDRQLGEKDLESTLTQETSIVNIMGECAGVSSRIAPEAFVEAANDMTLIDPGTSPDSDVCHPIIDVGIVASEGAMSTNQVTESVDVGLMTSEGATSTDQVSSLGQSLLFREPLAEGGLHAAVSASSKHSVASLSVLPPDIQPNTFSRKGKRGKRNVEANKQASPLPEHLSVGEQLHGPGNLHNNKKPSRLSKSKQKKQDLCIEKNSIFTKCMKKTTRKGSRCKSIPVESSLLGIAELECSEESIKVQNGLETRALSGKDASNSQPEVIPPINKTKGRKLPRSSKLGAGRGRLNGAGRGRLDSAEKSGRRKPNAHGKTEEKCRTFDASLEASDGMSFSSDTKKSTITMSTQLNSKSNAGSKVVSEDVSSSVISAVGNHLALEESNHSLEGQSLSPQVAWVLCDDCEKWRCISVELANIIEETKCRWTCKDNKDKAFADCSIPQEKSDAEINAELGISDEDYSSTANPSSKGVDPPKLAASKRASWNHIKSNVFLHRSRKSQTIDEIMVCNCKPPRDGSLGCGDQCLNRILNIECVKGTCPCGDLCSNQQFQKRKYAKFKWFHSGKKGYGLQLQEDACHGKFLIEYVGEVLDLSTYEERQKKYASRGQKHFYFMTLNASEVIDACDKGNLGRFINHSCDPNCRTEKWMVKGEVCIGLFAIRDIKKGEEVTFDYNYVRVFGAAAKKCVCGSSQCRGYIGGDPLNSEIIVQGDSDEEDIDPVLVREYGEAELILNETVSASIDAEAVKHEEIFVQRKDLSIKCPPAVPDAEVCGQMEDTVEKPLPDIPMKILGPVQLEDSTAGHISDSQQSEESKQSLHIMQAEETIRKTLSDGQALGISLQSPATAGEVLSESIAHSKNLVSDIAEEKPNTLKTYSHAKSSRSSGTIKKGRSAVKSLISHKTKKLAPGIGSGQFEGVEGKLNELLDVDGGISKQKDATKGYLKLLFVTATEGDVNGCASQSTRDLSLILDAILKTKSRKVLVDVINKNGLQMLHNIMKQNRNNFTRTPIIRKLLKVFEFLAVKEILTPELINKDPPCSGMESFKESILKLTRANDIQVHQIARNFRDKWIPRNIRRLEPSDRDVGQLDPQHSYRCWHPSSKLNCRYDQGLRETDAIVISAAALLPASSGELDILGETPSLNQQVSTSAPVADNGSAGGTRMRKRKTRWDQPSDFSSPDPLSLSSAAEEIVETGSKFMKHTPGLLEQTSLPEISKQASGIPKEGNSPCNEVASTKNTAEQNVDDEAPPGFGSLQDNRSQVPLEISSVTGEVVMGHLQERYLSQLPVSYGIPSDQMQQFGTRVHEEDSQCSPHWAIAPGVPFHPFPPLPSYPRGEPDPREGRQQSHVTSYTDLTIPSTSGGGPAGMVDTGFRDSQFNVRPRWPYNGPGRRFLRPQRWNNRRFQRCGPSVPRQRNCCGFRGGIGDGTSNLGVGNVTRDVGGSLCPPEVVSNDVVNSNSYQQSNHN